MTAQQLEISVIVENANAMAGASLVRVLAKGAFIGCCSHQRHPGGRLAAIVTCLDKWPDYQSSL